MVESQNTGVLPVWATAMNFLRAVISEYSKGYSDHRLMKSNVYLVLTLAEDRTSN